MVLTRSRCRRWWSRWNLSKWCTQEETQRGSGGGGSWWQVVEETGGPAGANDAGTANTGGGAGGSHSRVNRSIGQLSGGSGIVIIRYKYQ